MTILNVSTKNGVDLEINFDDNRSDKDGLRTLCRIIDNSCFVSEFSIKTSFDDSIYEEFFNKVKMEKK